MNTPGHSSDAVIKRLNAASKTLTEPELSKEFEKEWSVTKTERERNVKIVLKGSELQGLSDQQLEQVLVGGGITDRVRCAILIGRRRVHKNIASYKTGQVGGDGGLFALADITLQCLLLHYPILCDGRVRVLMPDSTFTMDVYPSRSVLDWLATTPGFHLPVVSNSSDKEAAIQFALHPSLKPSLGRLGTYYSDSTVLDTFFEEKDWVKDHVTRFQQVNLLMLIGLLEISATRIAMKGLMRPPNAALFHLGASLHLRDQLSTCLGAAAFFGANPIFSAFLYDDLAQNTAGALKGLAHQFSTDDNFVQHMRQRALETVAFLMDSRLDLTPDPFSAGRELCNGLAAAELCQDKVSAAGFLFDQLVGSSRISRRSSMVVKAEPQTILNFIDGVRSVSGTPAPEPGFQAILSDAIAKSAPGRDDSEAFDLERYKRLELHLEARCTEQAMHSIIEAESERTSVNAPSDLNSHRRRVRATCI